MIWIDFAIIGLISISLLIGLLRGFSLGFYSLMNWILATWVSLTFSREFEFFLKPALSDPAARIATSFVILFFITLLVGGLIRVLLGELVKKNHLTILERLGGMIVGIAHSIVVVTIIVMLTGLSVLPQSPWWKESKLLPPFQTFALWLRDHVPSELAKHVRYQ
ncbi:MAG: CvpA family protein [Methylococcaceae bacterium]